MDEIKINKNNLSQERDEEEENLFKHFTKKDSEKVIKYHKSLPNYKETPLIELTGLSIKLGVSNIWVKDESKRFDLNAFKVLGSSYAIARYILGESDDIRYNTAVAAASNVPEDTLVSATDGNHGYGLAHVGNLFHRTVKIYMPIGTVPMRSERIRKLGASVEVTDFNYDKCVDLAKEFAAETNGLFVQDTALESDTEEERRIPLYIMQGYMTILEEAFDQNPSLNLTHVFLQCGVGSFAGSLAAYLSNNIRPVPHIISVEPNNADCIFLSSQDEFGQARTISGDLDSIMAGLCCGVPSVQGWKILRKSVSHFVSCTDAVTKRGMRILANPLPGDGKIISGESGAVTMGLVYTLLTDDRYSLLKEKLNLTSESRILLVSTEGDTDPEGYYKHIWD